MEALKHCCASCVTRLQETFQIDHPSDHGLHKALDLKVLHTKRGSTLAHHLFCIFMLIQDDLPLAHRMAQAVYAKVAQPHVESWVNQTSYDTFFFSFLASFHPWLEDELTLVLRSLLLDEGLIKIQTAAPEQLLEQWFLGRFRAAMDLLEDEHSDHAEVPREPFEAMLQFGQDLLAGRAKLPVPLGITMPEELKPFCSSQSLVRLTVGQPTVE